MNPGGRLEVVPAIAAGVIASAIALVGFGLDSVMECAAAVVVGQLRGENQDRETRAVPPDRCHLLRPGAVPGGREHPRSHQPRQTLLQGLAEPVNALPAVPWWTRSSRRWR